MQGKEISNESLLAASMLPHNGSQERIHKFDKLTAVSSKKLSQVLYYTNSVS